MLWYFGIIPSFVPWYHTRYHYYHIVAWRREDQQIVYDTPHIYIYFVVDNR